MSTTDTVFYDNYRRYGQYINTYRSFPYFKDGLRPSERRILLTSYENSKDKFVKTAKIIGTCIAEYHPHGDVSLIGVIERLIDSGLMKGQGNWGFKKGFNDASPAAMRYTECKITKESEHLFFEYINAVEREYIELDPEPKQLTALIPGCFIIDDVYNGIGFGKQCKIPKFKVSDLVNRLLWLLKCIEQEPIINPDYKDELISGETMQLLTKGYGRFIYKTPIEETPKKKQIIIRQKPVIGFSILGSKLSKWMDSGNISIIDKSKRETEIEINIIKKGTDYNKLIKDINSALTYSITFNIGVVDDKNIVKTYGVDELLLSVFKNYHEYRIKSIDSKIEKLKLKIDDAKDIQIIKKYITTKKPNLEKYQLFLEQCSKNTTLTVDRISTLCQKYNLKNIIEAKDTIDEYTKEISELIPTKDIKLTVKEYLTWRK